jgi:hypothetical protein
MKRIAIAALIGMLAGCGVNGSPADPSPLVPPAKPTVPQFPVGPYWLRVTGYDVQVASVIPACDQPAGVPPAGKSVMVKLNVVLQGTEWVGRTDQEDGDLELRFRDTGELPFGLRGFTGTLSGEARDTAGPGATTPTDVRIAVDAGATVQGQTSLPFSSSVLSGYASGGIRFRDAAGRAGTCSAVAITMFTDPTILGGG